MDCVLVDQLHYSLRCTVCVQEGMKALQSCLSRFMNACTDMLVKYNDIRQEEVSCIFFKFYIICY